MFPKAFAYLVLAVFCWQIILPLPVLLDYAFRYKTYSEELCVNRFEPDSNCHGSCQVSKILQGESRPDSKPSMPLFKLAKDWLLSELSIRLRPQISVERFCQSKPLKIYQVPYLSATDKPPQTLILS